jgi:hypothetical protein
MLLAQMRQIELEERQLGICPPSQVGAALPESTICWNHVTRAFYEISPGVFREAGVDGYVAFEDGGTNLLDIPCGVREYVDIHGVTHILWVCPTSFSVLKQTRFDYVSGETHRWCVRSYTDDLYEERTYSRSTCLDVQWAWCLDDDALRIQCPLTEFP